MRSPREPYGRGAGGLRSASRTRGSTRCGTSVPSSLSVESAVGHSVSPAIRRTSHRKCSSGAYQSLPSRAGMYRESESDMLMGHYAALAENSTEQPRPVRPDAVDSEIEEHGHAWRDVAGPVGCRKTRKS